MFAVIAAKCFGVSLFWSRCTSSSLLQWSYHIWHENPPCGGEFLGVRGCHRTRLGGISTESQIPAADSEFTPSYSW